jgi:hypothetical protein
MVIIDNEDQTWFWFMCLHILPKCDQGLIPIGPDVTHAGYIAGYFRNMAVIREARERKKK